MATTLQTKHYTAYSIEIQPLGKHRAKTRIVKAGSTIDSLAKACLIAANNGMHVVKIIAE